jgi:SAM-dependent methyltransferase
MGTMTVRYWIVRYIEKHFGKPFTELSVLDIGCGYEPLAKTPNCTTFDHPTFRAYNQKLGRDYVPTHFGDALKIRETGLGTFDAVYSSHLLEDFVDTAQLVTDFASLLRDRTSVLILNLPDQKRYEVAEAGRLNPHHKIPDFGLAYMRSILPQTGLREIGAHEFWLDADHVATSRHGSLDYNFAIMLGLP